MFGVSGVEEAPYTVVSSDKTAEIRTYDSLILVSTPMVSDAKNSNSRSSAFRKLFKYISGENEPAREIPMTAPVFMDKDKAATMSFVLPTDYTIQTAPIPSDRDVRLEEVKDYTVAVIQFSGDFDQDNIDTYTTTLEKWIADNGYTQTGAAKAAGYNPPFTLPFLRRNEVLIPVKGE